MDLAAFLGLAGFLGHLVAALLHGGLAIWLSRSLRIQRSAQVPLIIALALLSFWALAVAWEGPRASISLFVETVRNAALLFLMFQLLRSDDSLRQPATVHALYAVLAGVLALQPVFDGIVLSFGAELAPPLLFYTSTILRMIFAVGALVLVHNLYSISAPQTRFAIRLPMAGLAVLWFFDLNLYAAAYLLYELPVELLALRGIIVACLMPVFALAAKRNGEWKIQLSRTVAFHSFSLIAIGLYLLAMALVVQLLSYFVADYARLTQVGLVFGVSLAALVLLPSNSFRAWFKVKIAKHFFQHRYDYRAEWMRFADTMSAREQDSSTLHSRIIQAVADITDSNAGLLLTPDEGGRFMLQERWNWPTLEVPAPACTASTANFFATSGFIVELDNVRGDDADDVQKAAIADWMVGDKRIWVIIPLIHFEKLEGLVILGRPTLNRTLDWEDLDMLRVVGRQAASYVAEQRGQNALLESRQFEDFNRRFAFVVHDIKNIVSQLALLSRNAEKHADKPEFREDMVETLQGTVAKLNATLTRLTNYRKSQDTSIAPLEVKALVKSVAKQKSTPGHKVQALMGEKMTVSGDKAALEQVLLHLVQNALDASRDNAQPVMLKWSASGIYGYIEIVDHGTGMSAEFIRTSLFKPFVSTKDGGFGIGAFEAKSLIEAMGGHLNVESREDMGTRMIIRLPLALDQHDELIKVDNSRKSKTKDHNPDRKKIGAGR
ncbi:MAG: XrtA/PEP-CTERM system histidine kinase PrsK [Pseudomonadota bacterium]